MRQNPRFIVLLSSLLIIALLLTACQMPRPGGDGGDISIPTPEVVTPAVEAPPVVEAPPTTEPPTAPTDETLPPDISQEKFPARAAPDAAAVEPGQVLVKLTVQAAMQARRAEMGPLNVPETDVVGLDQLLVEIGASDLEPVLKDVAEGMGQDVDSLSAQSEQVGQLFSIKFSPDKDPTEVANMLAQDPSVEFAEPNYIAGIVGQPGYIPAPFDPDDQYFRFQWHMQSIQMPVAWDMATGEGVIVAVVDTGIDFNAPDLATTKRLAGYDFVNNDNDPTDDQSHGTHVAGTIAQSTNNGVGVAGVAYDAQLLPVKVLGSNGNGSYENIIKGITYAVNQGAKVINMSLAGRQGSQGLLEAVQFAHSRGVVVVAAAGNSNGSVEYPAAYDDFVIAVGATRFDNTRARYSNHGPQIDLVAPGGDVDIDQNGDTYADGILQQTFKSPGNYTYLFFEGTSMASPHVAGLSALILSRKPDASPAEVESIMTQSARNLGSPDEYGAGLIQAADALAAIAPIPVTPSDTPTPQPPTPLPIPPTDTPTPEPVPPTNTPAPEPVPPTDTPTSEPPTSTPTLEPVPITATPTPTVVEPPTATPTPALPPLPAGELLLNGGFENDEGWIIYDTPIDAEYDTSVVLSGNRAAKLGVTSGQDMYSFTSIRQQVTIPAEAGQAILTANIYPITQDSPGTDIQYILILNSGGRIIKTLSQELSNSQTWETRTYDLADLRGQTIFIYFGVFNRGGTDRPSALYVDDVSLTWDP